MTKKLKHAARSIAEAIGRVLDDENAGHFAIIHGDLAKNYYVQFIAEKGDVELYGEAVSNDFLAPSHALGDRQRDKLRALGWAREDGGNFSKVWPAARVDERQAIAQELQEILADIYGVAPTKAIVIDVPMA